MPDQRPILNPDIDAGLVAGEQRISADSHMGEPPDLWEKRLPVAMRDRAMRFPDNKLYETDHHLRAGGWDPGERLKDLALDGISADVMFPTYGSRAWLISDHALEAAHVRVYNDWMIEFCSVAPERLWGLAMISFWDIDNAVKELERCKKAGLRGAAVWVGPPTELQFSSGHYEPFWAAAESLGMPVNLHINTGPRPGMKGLNQEPRAGLLPDGVHKFDCMKALGDIIASGALERHPDLKIVIAEAGVGWIPFYTQEFDYYFFSRGGRGRSMLPRPPSEYIYDRQQVFGAFISDRVGGYLLSRYGQDTFMWSTDYPHPACTWPTSGASIAQDLGHLDPQDRAKIICGNAARLYNNGQLPPAADPPGEHQSMDSWNKSHMGQANALAEALRGT